MSGIYTRPGLWQLVLLRRQLGQEHVLFGRPAAPAAQLACCSVQRLQPASLGLTLLKPCVSNVRRFFDPGLGNRALRRMQRRPRSNFQVCWPGHRVLPLLTAASGALLALLRAGRSAALGPGPVTWMRLCPLPRKAARRAPITAQSVEEGTLQTWCMLIDRLICCMLQCLAQCPPAPCAVNEGG